ncbi:MAG: NAD-binding protein [Candidatus Sericytochromatia bacterium]|nr:NAD-binding protein [Candidatus Sericytochromatia bacterium]
MPPEASPPRGHVILCGLGELGFRTLERLVAIGEAVRVIDPDPPVAFAACCEAWGVPLIRGSAREPATLAAAGLPDAEALVAVAGDDLTNLAVALVARVVAPDVRLVLRLFNERLVQRVTRDLPRCQVLDVAAVSAPIFAYASLHADILHCLDLPGGRFVLRRWPAAQVPARALRLAEGMTADGTHVVATLAEGAGLGDHHGFPLRPLGGSPAWRRLWRRAGRELAWLRRHDALWLVLSLIATMLGASALVFPDALGLSWQQAVYLCVQIITTVGFGDISILNGPAPTLWFVVGLMLLGSLTMAVLGAYVTEKLLSFRLGALLVRTPMPASDHFVIVGLGTVGFRIAEELVRAGHPCVAIERNPEGRYLQRARRVGVPVLVRADVFSALADAHLEDARGLIAVTDDDDTNLELALVAQEVNPWATCAVRLFEPDLAGHLERSFGIHLARSPSAIAAPAFATAAAGEHLLDAFDLGSRLFVAGCLRLEPGHPLLGAGHEAWMAAGLTPLSHRRAGEAWLALTGAEGWRPVGPGDEVIVVAPRDRWPGPPG